MILIVPRDDGVGISIGGEFHHITMNAKQLLELSHRFQKCGLEVLRREQLEAASALSDARRDSEPDDTSDFAPFH